MENLVDVAVPLEAVVDTAVEIAGSGQHNFVNFKSKSVH